MMPLHSRIAKYELCDDERFDFLKGLHKKVIRMDEVHPNKNADDYYIYLIWVKPNDEEIVMNAIDENIHKLSANDEWEFSLDGCVNTDGLIILHAWF